MPSRIQKIRQAKKLAYQGTKMRRKNVLSKNSWNNNQGKNDRVVPCEETRCDALKRLDKTACRRRRYVEKNKEKVARGKKRCDEKNPDKLASRKKRYEEKNPDKSASRKKRYEEKNPDKSASRKKRYDKKNPDKSASRKKRYEEKNPDKSASRKKRYEEKNPDKSASRKKRYDKKNPDKLASRIKRYDKKNLDKLRSRIKRYKNKNPDVVVREKSGWRRRHSESVLKYMREWRQRNPEKVDCIRNKWRLRNARNIHASWKKWYWKNGALKRIFRYKMYKERLQQEKRMRKQRYLMDLAIDAQYYRGNTLALIRAGEKAAESKFVRAAAKNIRTDQKRRHDGEVTYEATLVVAKALHLRSKIVRNHKRCFWRLKSHSDSFIDKANAIAENNDADVDEEGYHMDQICGVGEHCEAREPYFYEFAYKVVKQPSVVPIPCTQYAAILATSKDERMQEKVPHETWPCDPNKCLGPAEKSVCANRLIKICKKLTNVKTLRRYLAKSDNCPHTKHVKQDSTLGPKETADKVKEDNDYAYNVRLQKKLGNSLACLVDKCSDKSDLLFLRRMSVHYPSIAKFLRVFYDVLVCDGSLHKLDRALVKGDYKTLQAYVDEAMSDVEAVAPCAMVQCLEERLKSVRYAMEFIKKIQQKRMFACASCCTLHYRSGVTQIQLKENDVTGELEVYSGKNLNKKGAKKECNRLWKELFAFSKEKGRKMNELFVCDTCLRSLYNGTKHAPQSVFNNLRAAAVPKELSDLNEFEKQFIQKAKCFQVIYRLGTVQSKLPASDRVKAQKGQVVHYPLPISETLRTLPDAENMPDDPNLYIIVFGVPTKSKVVWKELVDVKKVQAALAYLKNVNPEYANINVERDPLESADLVEEKDEHDLEVLDACQQVAKRSMVRKIDENEEAFIVDSYTVRSLFDKKPQQNDLELYAMERVAAERIDSREAKLDLWCFPHLYPDGRNGEGEERDALSNQAFIRNRLFNEDSRFRLDSQYIFYILHKYQLRQVANAVLQQLRGSYQYNDVPVGEFIQRVAAGEQELEGNLHTMFSNCRGTQQYWSSIRRDLRTMVRELGPPTWFVTLSAAEYNWDDMREHLIAANKDVPGIEEMRNGERCAMDPVFTSEHFHHRFAAAFNDVLCANEGGPLGKVVDYFYRVEYQSRGAPHYHMLLWSKDAPKIGVNTNKEVLEFVQKHVTCRLPDKDNEPLLYKYVTHFLKHTCNDYCLKLITTENGRKHRRCRFGFPRAPTGVAVIHDALKNCAQRKRGNTKQRLYELVRSPEEERINDYNPELLLLWGANIDVQFVGEETLAVVNYVTDYVTKSERSDLDKLWSEVSKNQALSKQLFNFGCKALSARECGAYEAVDMITGRNLYSMSRSVVYINARKPHLRRRQLKTLSKLKEIEKNDPNCTEKFENNWITTYYPDRPDALEAMCLYDCRRLHDVMPAKDVQADDPMKFRNPAYGKLKLKTKPYLVSHPYLKYLEQREEYCYCLLLMFKPFRNEIEELIDPASSSCIPVFEQELTCNERMREHHDKLQKHQNQQEKNIKAIEEETNKLAAEDDAECHADDVAVMGEPIEACDAMQEVNAMMQLSGEGKLEDNLENMNADQRRIYERLIDHLSGNGDVQLLMFISGAGGTGKSFLVNTLRMWAKEQFKEISGTTIAVAAPTGLAAYNVNGVTLHRLLQLPVQHNLDAKYTSLSDDVCKELRQNLKHLKLLFIDEISMVSNVMLAYSHLRLNQVCNRGEESMFGGLNMIVMGDLAQLTPVGDKPAFCGLSPSEARKKIGSVGGTDLWKNFTYDELTENMRQKDDLQFANLLNRLRFGHMTEEDVAVLKTRLIPVPEGVSPMKVFTERFASLRTGGEEMVCLMAKADMVAEFNERMLEMENREIIELPAEDSFQWNGRPASAKAVESAKRILAKKEEKITETAGVEATLRVCLGARVMLRRNINVEAGLVNGAIGSIVDIKKITGKVVSLKVKFDNIDEVQELERKMVKFALTKQIYVSRGQFPLILSYAMTIHKSQGLSLSRVMVDVGNSIFQDGMTYVALSRVRTLDGLYLMNFDPSKANANKACIGEINRLRSTLINCTLAPIEVSKRKLKWEPDRIWCKCMDQAWKKANQGKSAEEERSEGVKKGTRKRRATAKSGGAPSVKKPRRKTAGEALGKETSTSRKRRLNNATDGPQAVKKPRESAKGNTVTAKKPTGVISSTSGIVGAGTVVSSKQRKPLGLRNTNGVACYSNSAMHALMALRNFALFCEDLVERGDDVSRELLEFKRSYQTKCGVLSTRQLRLALAKSGLPFADADGQQCAMEFIRGVLEKVGFDELFMVSWREKYICEYTPGERHTWYGDIEQDISLNVLPRRPNGSLVDWISAVKPRANVKCRICDNVGGVCAIVEPVMLPEQLIIWIFRYGGSIDDDAAVECDLASVNIAGERFKIVAAIQHIGNLNAGHYVAYVRRNDIWYECNDSKVTMVDGPPHGMKTISFLILDKEDATVMVNI